MPALRIAVTGATGFIGSHLVPALRRNGDSVHRIVRSRPDPGDIVWSPRDRRIDAAALEGMDAVIHLAGENIAQRWTSATRRRIRESRVAGTSLLASTMAALERPPRVMISASAVGFYGADRGDETLDESSAPGDDFLADVAVEWEAATEPAASRGIRVVRTRFGVVLHPEGGMLQRVLPIFRLGLGGRLGDGRQWMSWIALDDLIEAVRFALRTPTIAGGVNVTAPTPVRNEEFTRVLGKVLGRPTMAVVPAFAIRAVFGEMGDATILASQRVLPGRLLEAGFQFEQTSLESALRSELGS
ncbi:MAG TPA: TIGR01777 family oxidoreductase [Gemmatimonadaceae bacterium]|nr:TIGR01777 family oxidoreductase [Gemmatimonadaceae bacterium]